jgi:hypothetical protein
VISQLPQEHHQKIYGNVTFVYPILNMVSQQISLFGKLHIYVDNLFFIYRKIKLIFFKKNCSTEEYLLSKFNVEKFNFLSFLLSLNIFFHSTLYITIF